MGGKSYRKDICTVARREEQSFLIDNAASEVREETGGAG
jgi:hypothetical protein